MVKEIHFRVTSAYRHDKTLHSICGKDCIVLLNLKLQVLNPLTSFVVKFEAMFVYLIKYLY